MKYVKKDVITWNDFTDTLNEMKIFVKNLSPYCWITNLLCAAVVAVMQKKRIMIVISADCHETIVITAFTISNLVLLLAYLMLTFVVI